MNRRIAAALIAALAFAPALAGCENSRASECRNNGGTVTSETETETKNGKLKVYTEYECTRDGQEIDEWRVG